MKVRLNLLCDPSLKDIMKHHCKCNDIAPSNWISELIAKELNVPLNHDGSVDEKYYVDAKIRELNECIDKLKKERKELEAKL